MKKATIIVLNTGDLQEADRRLPDMACKITDGLFHMLATSGKDAAMIGVMEICTMLTVAHHAVQTALQATADMEKEGKTQKDGTATRMGNLTSDVSPELYAWALQSFEEMSTIPAEKLAICAMTNVDEYKKIIATARNACAVCASCREAN